MVREIGNKKRGDSEESPRRAACQGTALGKGEM